MRSVLNLVATWYLGLTALALAGVSTLQWAELVPGIAMLWLAFAFFSIPARHARQAVLAPKVLPPKSIRSSWLLLLALGALVASNLAISTYTGQSMSGAFGAISRAESLYNQYQYYFIQQGLSEFSIEKLPGILAGLVLKFILFFVSLKVLLLAEKRNLGHWIAWLIVVISYLTFSVSRGTSFEVFEVLLMIVFALALRPTVLAQQSRRSTLKLIVIISLAVLALYVYTYNIAARYGFGEKQVCATATICRETSGYIVENFPKLADLLFDLQVYFTFGTFYTSTFIDGLWFESFREFSIHLLPLGYFQATGRFEGGVCNVLIDCGVAWKPAMVMHLQYLGVVGFILMLCSLGWVARKLVESFENGIAGVFESAALFLIVFYLISLPVGNFVFVSSSNICVTALVFGGLVVKWLGIRLSRTPATQLNAT